MTRNCGPCVCNAGRVLVHTCLDARRLLGHTSLDIDPPEPRNIPVVIAFECTQLAPHRVRLKASAFRNMFFMFVALEASHCEMSRLNDVAPWNMPDMSLTFDTSQPVMEQAHFGTTRRQLSRAFVSCPLDRGANPLACKCQSLGTMVNRLRQR